jgi:hypothetical protein
MMRNRICISMMKGGDLMKKRLVAVLLLAVMALTISAYASTRASVIQPGLSFAGTNANCSLIVAGDLGNESISATIKLNRGSINLKTWYTTGTGDLLFSDSSITTPKGYSYTLTADVTINGKVYAPVSLTKKNG